MYSRPLPRKRNKLQHRLFDGKVGNLWWSAPRKFPRCRNNYKWRLWDRKLDRECGKIWLSLEDINGYVTFPLHKEFYFFHPVYLHPNYRIKLHGELYAV